MEMCCLRSLFRNVLNRFYNFGLPFIPCRLLVFFVVVDRKRFMITQVEMQLWRILEVEPMLSAKMVMMDALLICIPRKVLLWESGDDKFNP